MERFVIFSGANERAIIAACRYLTARNLAFSIVARPGNDKIKLTRFKRNVETTRNRETLDVADMLAQLQIIQQRFANDRLVYLPTAESINRILLAQREQFEQAGLNITLVNEQTYTLISDKFSFQQQANNYGIATPAIIVDIHKATYPYVAKPRQEFSSVHGGKIYPHLIFTAQDYVTFAEHEVKEDFFYQRYINGQSFYYLMFFPPDAEPLVVYQKNLLQQSRGKSVIYAESCRCPDKVFESKIITMLRDLQFQGFIMVEAIKNEAETVIIEANPRLWGPYELAIGQGLTPDLLLGHSQPAIKNHKRLRYLWINGLWLTWSKAEKPKYYGSPQRISWDLISHLVHDIYIHRDSLPLYFSEIKQALAESFQNITGWCRHACKKK